MRSSNPCSPQCFRIDKTIQTIIHPFLFSFFYTRWFSSFGHTRGRQDVNDRARRIKGRKRKIGKGIYMEDRARWQEKKEKWEETLVLPTNCTSPRAHLTATNSTSISSFPNFWAGGGRGEEMEKCAEEETQTAKAKCVSLGKPLPFVKALLATPRYIRSSRPQRIPPHDHPSSTIRNRNFHPSPISISHIISIKGG